MEIIQIVGGLASLVGGLTALIGWIWLVMIGFKQGGTLWGILIFFFSVFAGIIFCIINKTGWLQLAMMVVGGLIAGVGIISIIPMITKMLESMQ